MECAKLCSCLKTVQGEVMAQYLVAIHLPDDFDPSAQDKAMEHDIDVLNEEMEAKALCINKYFN
jgi:hypothetical protein